MSTHNICFYGEMRKIFNTFKKLVLSGAVPLDTCTCEDLDQCTNSV